MVPNSIRGRVPVQLDRPRIVFFSFNSLAALRDRLGVNYLAKLIEKDGENWKIKSYEALRTFLYAGLVDDADQNGELLTEMQVGRLMKPENVQHYIGAVLEAFNAFLDKQSGKEKEVDGADAASTSKKPRRSQSRT